MGVGNLFMSEDEGDAFDILALEAQFDLSLEFLENTYIILQKSIHPDVFVGQTEIVRLASARRASRVNQAYQQLKTPLQRAELLFKRQGLWPLSSVPEALQEAMVLREEKEEANNQGVFEEKVTALLEESMRLLTQAFEEKAWTTATREYLRLSYLQKLQ